MNARAIIEAESPKRALRQAAKQRIWPSEDYYINVIKDGERWEDGEFCPVGVRPDGSVFAFDGMYGVLADVGDAVNYRDNDPESEAASEHWMNVYEGGMFEAIRNGQISGTIDGIIGPRHWRLVYQSRDDRQSGMVWNPASVIPVEKGKAYGQPMVGEAENPKKALRRIRQRSDNEVFNVGWVEINVELSNGQRVRSRMPIGWIKWQDQVIVDLAVPGDPGLTKEQWLDVAQVVDYGLNEGANSADHHDFRDEDDGNPYMTRMYWKILGGQTNSELEYLALRHFFPEDFRDA